MIRIMYLFPIFILMILISCSDDLRILSDNLKDKVSLKMYYANEESGKKIEKPLLLHGHEIYSLSSPIVDSSKIEGIYLVRYKNEKIKVMIVLTDDEFFYNHKSPSLLVTEIDGELVAAATTLPKMKSKIIKFPASYLSNSYNKYLLQE